MQLLDVLSSIFIFFLMVAWIWTLVGVVSDVFRSKDLSGLAKAIWVLFIIMVPWLGVLSYIVIRGQSMSERNMQALSEAGDAQRAYIQGIAGTSTADELSKLSKLRDKGVITDSEFETQKVKLLG